MISNYNLLEIASNCFFSIKSVLTGVISAIIIGILAGLFRSTLPNKLKRNIIIKFLMDAPKFPPPIAWIPFVLLLFGVGEIASCAIVFIGAYSPIFTNAYEGAESVPVMVRNTAKSMEIRGIRFLFLIILPYALPQILTGIKVGISMGWMAVIAAEMVSGQSGLGYSIQLNRTNLQYDLIVVDVILVGLIGFLLFEGITKLEKKMIPWFDKTIF